MGTPSFSTHILSALYHTFPNSITAVITRPDTPKGRKKTPTPSPVKEWALAHTDLPIYTPQSKSELSRLFSDISPDLVVVVAYGVILPKDVTDTYFCTNIHTSLLPHYRGASPIQSALLNGDKSTGISLIKMNENMDEGDILSKTEIPITPTDTFGHLESKLSTCASNLIVEWITNHWIPQTYTLTPQNHQMATYCSKISKDDLKLNLNLPAQTLLHKIKAYSPKPGAYIMYQNKRIKLLDATVKDNELQILTVQPEGKAPMSYSDYCLGNPKGCLNAD